MTYEPPVELNIADYFLDARVREGRGDRVALIASEGARTERLTYREVQALANRFARVLSTLGVEQEQRVIVALPDIPAFASALFGVFKMGGVAAMVNPALRAEEIRYFYDYTRARVAIVHRETLAPFAQAARGARHPRQLLVVGGGAEGHASFESMAAERSDGFDNVSTHRDDAALWLFSGGTTGRPKAVVQSHASYANTTELYAKDAVGYRETDVTLSVPKLYFGYATGCNLFFPFAVGATAILFPERCTADVLFDKIRAFRPTILVNVPTMVNQMVSSPSAARQDLSCLRFSTSAGEALPVELYERWKRTFGVELLDGLGTAEMWHIFLTNRPGAVRPGTLGTAVPGFEVKVCDGDGRELPAGEVGELWVRGNSRAIGYWQQMDRTMAAFRGDWYVSGDLIVKDSDGYVTYCGRSDDMLKVGGKWVAPGEVESCLLAHPDVLECAVVGVKDAAGLTKPRAYVVARVERPGLDLELKTHVKENLAPYKYPREIVLLPELPRTHLGKVDRARLRAKE